MTTVVPFSRTVFDIESTRQAIGRTLTTLIDRASIKSTSALAVFNALAEIKGTGLVRFPEGRDKHHYFISLLCVVPDSLCQQVLFKSDGLNSLPLGSRDGYSMFLLSGTLHCFLECYEQWLTVTALKEYNGCFEYALQQLGINGSLPRLQK